MTVPLLSRQFCLWTKFTSHVRCVLVLDGCTLKRFEGRTTSPASSGNHLFFSHRNCSNSLRNDNKNVTDKVLTIPNLLTFGRLLSAPAITYFVLTDMFPSALGLFVIAGATDLIDGYIARRWKGQTSVLGSILDPLADKVLITSLSISLCYADFLPVWLVGLILLRDFCLVIGAAYLRFTSLPTPKTFRRYFDVSLPTVQIKPLLISKLNTGIQLLLITATLSSPVFGCIDHPAIEVLRYLTATTTFFSGIGYIFSNNTFSLIAKKPL